MSATSGQGLIREPMGTKRGRQWKIRLPLVLSVTEGRVGVALAAMILAFLVIAQFFAPDPNAQELSAQLEGPSFEHVLGTDQFGRDQLARIAAGGLRSLLGAAIVMGVAFLVGLVVGVIAGAIGGLLDSGAMRLVDVFLAMPSLIVAIAIVGVLGPAYENLLLAMILAVWPFYARIARGFTAYAHQRLDVATARLAGIHFPRILVQHIVPTVAARLLVVASLDFGFTIVALAGLSYLGLGAQPPTAEWGVMFRESQDFFVVAPWLLIVPGSAIVLTVTAANLIGEALHRVHEVGSDR